MSEERLLPSCCLALPHCDVTKHLQCNVGAEITYFEAGEDPISLYYVVCSGDEERLSDCSYSEYNMDYCLHAADIGVVCQASGEGGVLGVMIVMLLIWHCINGMTIIL